MTKQAEHKLHGLIDTIVQSVRDKSIDIPHVFSKDFAIEHGYDESNRQDFIDQLRNNWYDLRVTKVRMLGDAEPKTGDWPGTPDDELDNYISFQINVLSWAKHETQAAEL